MAITEKQEVLALSAISPKQRQKLLESVIREQLHQHISHKTTTEKCVCETIVNYYQEIIDLANEIAEHRLLSLVYRHRLCQGECDCAKQRIK